MRKNGVLLHISSLPSEYGIGTLGKKAYEFVDYLKGAGQSYWQILPVCPTSFGDSPYASYSTFAGNPYFIDLDLLAEEGLLKPEEYQNEVWFEDPENVDYGLMYNTRYPVLKKAVKRFLKNPPAEYVDFIRENREWLEDYALFMALKEVNDGKSWLEWPDEFRLYSKEKAQKWKEDYAEDVNENMVLQYLFTKQWQNLRDYANENGIEIIGDLPIYVAMDSADAWSQPELFMLDENRKPYKVAGCPPDGFSATGQLWGNPVYDWQYHKDTGYKWWIHRIEYLTKLYNVLRIDHFRGFDSFYAIPYGATDACSGVWMEGPGIDLFEKMEEKIGPQKIIAEDLGFLTPSVKQLLKDSGYPGMKVLQFAFDSRDDSSSDYLPFNYPRNSVAYIGTHDNDTIQGWQWNADPHDVALCKDYIDAGSPHDFHWDMIRQLLASKSDTAIVTAQDLLGLGTESRMNIPSTVGCNWKWRLLDGELDQTIQKELLHLTKLYGRLPK